jgi:hypothetical protein
MKQIVLLFAIVFTPFLAQAQITVEIVPDPLEFDFVYGNNELADDYYIEPVAHAVITNTSSTETFTMVWVREVIDAPAEWEYRTCDNTQCYPSFITTNWNPNGGSVFEDLVVLEPGEESLLDMHVLPRHTPGFGVVRLTIYDYYDLDNEVAIADYEVTINTVNSVSEEEINTLRVFPNPTTDFFILDGEDVVDKIVVYNLLGRPVRFFAAAPGMRYDLGGLADGLYLVGLINEEKGTLKTIRLSKRGFQP